MLENEEEVEIFYHPISYRTKPQCCRFHCKTAYVESDGTWTYHQQIAKRRKKALVTSLIGFACLPAEYKRFENPHVYKVGISPSLMRLRTFLFEQMQKVRW